MSRRWFQLLVLSLSGLMPAVALGQATVDPAPKVSQWPNFIIAVVLVLGVIVVSVMSSKRGHQD